jgi:hypothetical protein
MIHPQLATMLVYLFTDVEASARELQPLAARSLRHSLNCMSIDGDTSTNDTVLLLASGASGVRADRRGTRKKFPRLDRGLPVAGRADCQRWRRACSTSSVCLSNKRAAGKRRCWWRGRSLTPCSSKLRGRAPIRIGDAFWRPWEDAACPSIRRASRFLLAVRRCAATESPARSTSGKLTANLAQPVCDVRVQLGARTARGAISYHRPDGRVCADQRRLFDVAAAGLRSQENRR